MVNLVIKSNSFGNYTNCKQDLKRIGVKFVNYEDDYDNKFLINEAKILILDTSNINHIIKKTKKLKYIFRIGKGIDNLDLDLLKKKEISYRCFYKEISNSVSELIISLIFNLIRRINISDINIKNSIWKKIDGYTLNDIKIGFLGFGEIAYASALKISKLTNNEIFFYDIDKNKKFPRKKKFKFLSIKNLFKKCDLISINIPYSRKSKNLINKDLLSLTSDNFMMINTSRGGIVNENDLFNFLNKNKNSYVAMDVFNHEPYYGKLSQLDNIILTPHIGSLTIEFRSKVEHDILGAIKKYYGKI